MPRGVRKDRTASGRNERPLLGGFQSKLSAPQRKGYVRRWVNDDPGRLEGFQAAAYDFVPDQAKADEEGRAPHMSKRVGTNADGSPKNAYLMEKREDWYDEDMARKAERRDAREAQIFREEQPEHDSKTSNKDRGRFYTKHAEINT